MDMQDDQITVGSGNVFRDTGASDPESRLAKVDLASQIMEIVDEHRWTQKEAAERFGIDQPNMSRILAGKLRGFSIDRLLQLLANAGYDVDIIIGSTSTSKREGSIAISRTPEEALATSPQPNAMGPQTGRPADFDMTINQEAGVGTGDA